MSLSIWATFVGKFVMKNFRKSPNLVTPEKVNEKRQENDFPNPIMLPKHLGLFVNCPVPIR